MKERRIADRRQYDRRSTGQKKRRFGGKVIVLLIIVVLFVAVWYQRNREEKTVEQEIKAPVVVMTPHIGTLAQELTITGYVESETMVTVLPKISGTLTELFVDIGDSVSKGRIIGTIDSEPYRLTLRQAEAAYLAAKSTFERTEQLFQAKATSKQNYDQAKSHYDAMKSQYELTQLNFQYTRIEAPIGGVVLKKHTTAGSLVANQVPIVTIGDLDDLIIKANIPETYYARFNGISWGNAARPAGLAEATGQSVSGAGRSVPSGSERNTVETGAGTGSRMAIVATVPALDNREFTASIRTVAPYISPETKNFEIICEFEGDTAAVRPGMFVYLRFELEKKQNIAYLPFEVLTGGRYLWYVEEEEEADLTAKRMAFDVGYSNNDFFEVPESYTTYRFIVEGQHFLTEGQKVKIVEDS